jgi:hypothetical protein
MKKLILALLLATALPARATVICDPSGKCAAVGVTAALPPAGATAFKCGLAALAASLTECQALAASRVYYITDIVVGTTTATSGTYGVQVGTGTNCGTNTATIFPAPPATTASRYQAPIAANPVAVINFTTPLVTPAGYAICVIGVATNTINIQITGYYK